MPSESTLSDGQSIALAVVSSFSSLLSLLGSTCILIVAGRKLSLSTTSGGRWRMKRQQRKNQNNNKIDNNFAKSTVSTTNTRNTQQQKSTTAYQRIMISMSLSDILLSLAIITSPYSLPSTANYPMAVGNMTTCQATGSVIVMATLWTTWMCFFLSIYFILTIKYNWKESVVAQKLEVPAYLVAMIYTISIAILALVSESIRPAASIQICTVKGSNKSGAMASSIRWIYSGSLLILAIGGIIATYQVYKYVHQTTSNIQSREMFRDKRKVQRVQQVAIQAALYISALVNSLLWPTLISIIVGLLDLNDQAHEPGIYTLLIIGGLMMPLQGFFNFWIYIRSRVHAWKTQFPELSWWHATYIAIITDERPCGSTVPTTKTKKKKSQNYDDNTNNATPQNRQPYNRVISRRLLQQRHEKSKRNSTRLQEKHIKNETKKDCNNDDDDDDDDNGNDYSVVMSNGGILEEEEEEESNYDDVIDESGSSSRTGGTIVPQNMSISSSPSCDDHDDDYHPKSMSAVGEHDDDDLESCLKDDMDYILKIEQEQLSRRDLMTDDYSLPSSGEISPMLLLWQLDESCDDFDLILTETG